MSMFLRHIVRIMHALCTNMQIVPANTMRFTRAMRGLKPPVPAEPKQARFAYHALRTPFPLPMQLITWQGP